MLDVPDAVQALGTQEGTRKTRLLLCGKQRQTVPKINEQDDAGVGTAMWKGKLCGETGWGIHGMMTILDEITDGLS